MQTYPAVIPHLGETVAVKVIDLDIPKCRLGLSIRQTQPDPIKVTLDTVQWGATKSMPDEMQRLMDRIREQPGVEDVHIGRQAIESKIASQVRIDPWFACVVPLIIRLYIMVGFQKPLALCSREER